MSANLQYHEAANIFPMMDDAAFREFKEDIKANGLIHPVELLDGKIIDGRNRYLACLELGIKCAAVAKNIDDPVAYVLSQNLHRRQLTASQRSMIADKVRGFHEDAAKRRMQAGGGDHRSKNAKSGKEILPYPVEKGQARDTAGKSVGVSGKMVDLAHKVREKGTLELAKAVEEGRMSVTAAAELADEPADVQKEAAQAAKASGGRYRNPRPSPKGTDGRPVGGQIATEAMQIVTIVISQMTRIRKDDPKRQSAFDKIIKWIEKNRSSK